MSGYVEVTPELLAGFLDEAREYIETLNRDLMQSHAVALAVVATDH